MWYIVLVAGAVLMAIYILYVWSIQRVINQRIQLAEEAAERMHASMQADGVPTTQAPADDAEPAAVPFLAILPDMTLHVALLEHDIFADTAPLATRTLPLAIITAGDTSRSLGTPAQPPPHTRSARFIPPSSPPSNTSWRDPTDPPDATGGVSTSSISIQITGRQPPPHSQPNTSTMSGRLRQFGLAALPSLRRAELADIPDSLVWSVAVIAAPDADHHPHLTRENSATSRLGRLAPSRSLRRRDASSSRALGRIGSLGRSGSMSHASGAASGVHVPAHARTSPLQTFTSTSTGAAGQDQLIQGMHGASAPVLRGVLAPAPPGKGQSSARLAPASRSGLPEDAPAAPGSVLAAGGSGNLTSESGGAMAPLGVLQGQPGRPQRTKSLRRGRSFRSGGGDGYERLEDVHEMPGDVP